MRTIFHCDINNCFASIEMAMNPSLRGLPIAVCGDPASRRGIVLAKSEKAKACGVSTGDPLWRAREKCPDIRFIPPHFEVYERYSRNFRKYLLQYTPKVEPYGLDECWMDVSSRQFARVRDALPIAEKIRQDIWRIFGVTVSVGVSFNKVFAKIGSDMKKPDAVTVIDKDEFKYKIWSLPVTALLGVGRSTAAKLHQRGIYTIGQLAESPREYLSDMFGKNGRMLHQYANGWDESPVALFGERRERQSLGHGTTLPADVWSLVQLWPVIESLAEQIAFTLQSECLGAYGIQIMVRDQTLQFHQYQMTVRTVLESSHSIAEYAQMLLDQKYDWNLGVHAFEIRLYQLVKKSQPRQLSLFEYRNPDRIRQEKQNLDTDTVIQQIQQRFGDASINRGYQLEMFHRQPGFFPGCEPVDGMKQVS